MIRTSSITMPSMVGIVGRAGCTRKSVLFLPAQRCRYCFTQWSKNGFLAPQERHVAPINMKFGVRDRAASTLLRAKCHVYRGKNVGIHPQNCQNFEFWPEICALGASRLQYFLTKSSVFEVGRKVTDLGHPCA